MCTKGDSMTSRSCDFSESTSNKENCTHPKPFSFEDRELSLIKRREERIAKAQLHAKLLANSFKAQPMRVGSPDSLPPRVVRSPVHPVPFHLLTEERIALHKSRREANTTIKPTITRARTKSPSVIYKPPFIPTLPERPPVIAVSPELATTSRAASRSKYDDEAQKRRDILQQQLELNRLKRMKDEANEIRQIRKESVHKPEPIRRYKTIRSPTRKPPTVPKSPMFSTSQKRANEPVN
ncbi:Targeting protein for Xklp2 [Schistosoma japonicum]|uniref:Targeting protein for Xklp2 n=1 Tax=Schistosoma japonicum TaxID=6182 RepID=A0A4Z2D9I2_SCHJA|nr:Targeting protein for Xklp2 [Schistosoma japonicum]KAH8868596.1 Targeting protein for Xklp2 [Schistosoma japonicum]TNN13161.1 Targeting protein for Xklp2 [Schistosoma japonicum]TNN13162.1 Targeting protein for Xklp2 [Schistosoma japonicum]